MAQPNILVIMSDQHHKGAMGCAGHPLVQTPHLDALAGRGTRFANGFCNYPLCGPSRASFMTCRHPYETGVWTNDGEIRTDMPTFAHAFHAGGYETILSGRMHFVGVDQRHGFERRLIGDVPESAYIAAGWKLRNVLGYLVDTPGMSRTGLDKSGPGWSGYLEYDEAVTQATVSCLNERAKSKENRPLMMVVGYAMPHCPFVAPPDDFYRYYNDVPEPTLSDADLADQHPFLETVRRNWGTSPMPPSDVQRRVTAAYYGMVSHLDRQIGELMRALDNNDMADETIVVYTSDHGEQLGEHGLWWKSTFYDASVGVPLLIRRPDDENPAVSSANVSLMDIGPTLLDLVGLAPVPGASGRSFRCVLDGQSSDWDDHIFAEYTAPDVPQRMVKRGRYKYAYYHGMRPQLFDLEADPDELHDLHDSSEHQALRQELHAALMANWDPEQIAQRQQETREGLKLIGSWQRHVRPPEPDPVWFDTPPDNHIDAIR